MLKSKSPTLAPFQRLTFYEFCFKRIFEKQVQTIYLNVYIHLNPQQTLVNLYAAVTSIFSETWPSHLISFSRPPSSFLRHFFPSLYPSPAAQWPHSNHLRSRREHCPSSESRWTSAAQSFWYIFWLNWLSWRDVICEQHLCLSKANYQAFVEIGMSYSTN